MLLKWGYVGRQCVNKNGETNCENEEIFISISSYFYVHLWNMYIRYVYVRTEKRKEKIFKDFFYNYVLWYVKRNDSTYKNRVIFEKKSKFENPFQTNDSSI